MRISDWSSDVCSSDLKVLIGVHDCSSGALRWARRDWRIRWARWSRLLTVPSRILRAFAVPATDQPGRCGHTTTRSDEHTSGVPAVMHIEFPVLWIKNYRQVCTKNEEASVRTHDTTDH